jgi:hypothetical protein
VEEQNRIKLHTYLRDLDIAKDKLERMDKVIVRLADKGRKSETYEYLRQVMWDEVVDLEKKVDVFRT